MKQSNGHLHKRRNKTCCNKLEEENVKDLRFPTQAKMAESNKNAVTWVCYMRAHGRLTILPDHLKWQKRLASQISHKKKYPGH